MKAEIVLVTFFHDKILFSDKTFSTKLTFSFIDWPRSEIFISRKVDKVNLRMKVEVVEIKLAAQRHFSGFVASNLMQKNVRKVFFCKVFFFVPHFTILHFARIRAQPRYQRVVGWFGGVFG